MRTLKVFRQTIIDYWAHLFYFNHLSKNDRSWMHFWAKLFNLNRHKE